MVLNDIRSLLRQLESLSAGWTSAGDIPQIERDLALDKLRNLYDALCAFKAPAVDPALVASEEINLDDVLSVGVVESAPFFEPEVQSAASFEPEIEDVKPVVDINPAAPADESFEVQPESIPPQEEPDSVEPQLEPKDAQLHEEPKSVRGASKPQAESVTPSLFGANECEEQLRHRHKQRVLRSLYGMDEPASEPTPAPNPRSVSVLEPMPAPEAMVSEPVAVTRPEIQPALVMPEPQSDEDDDMVIEEIEITMDEATPAEPTAEKGTVLGEVINHDVHTLGDSLTVSHHTDPTRHDMVTDLRKSIGINDRFLMIRDLFGGDSAAYERSIEAIDDFADLDDCMIYISENYAWNPNSDGAKLLMGLIERKLA